MSIVRNKIFESPDEYYDPNNDKYVVWNDIKYKPVTFGWYEGKLFTKEPKNGDTFSTIHAKLHPKYDEDGSKISRSDWTTPGRLWLKTKVISFWEYPEKEELVSKLRELENKLNINILKDPDWRIEIYSDPDRTTPYVSPTKLVRIKDYVGSAAIPDDEKGKQHAISPMLKKPKSSAARKYISQRKQKPLAWRQAMYAEGKIEIVRSKL